MHRSINELLDLRAVGAGPVAVNNAGAPPNRGKLGACNGKLI
jgi:hypothetical protein